MKSLLRSPNSLYLKTVFLIVQLALCFGGPTVAQAGEKNPLSLGFLRPGHLDRRAGLPQGSLKVYSTTDEFNDGNAWYFPHTFYAIYTIDGKLFRNVTSYFGNDEPPEVVALPVGSYLIVARSEKEGHVRVPIVIKAGERTILDLDLREKGTLKRIAFN
jgi:hypothetical protein